MVLNDLYKILWHPDLGARDILIQYDNNTKNFAFFASESNKVQLVQIMPKMIDEHFTELLKVVADIVSAGIAARGNGSSLEILIKKNGASYIGVTDIPEPITKHDYLVNHEMKIAVLLDDIINNPPALEANSAATSANSSPNNNIVQVENIDDLEALIDELLPLKDFADYDNDDHIRKRDRADSSEEIFPEPKDTSSTSSKKYKR